MQADWESEKDPSCIAAIDLVYGKHHVKARNSVDQEAIVNSSCFSLSDQYIREPDRTTAVSRACENYRGREKMLLWRASFNSPYVDVAEEEKTVVEKFTPKAKSSGSETQTRISVPAAALSLPEPPYPVADRLSLTQADDPTRTATVHFITKPWCLGGDFATFEAFAARWSPLLGLESTRAYW